MSVDDLGAHVGDVEARDLAGVVEDLRRLLGLVGVDVDLQRRVVADDEDRVADLLQPRHERPGLEVLAGDGEVGAVAVGLAGVLRVRDARRGVVLQLGRLGAAQGGDDAREDDRHAVAAGVDHARLAEDRQQIGAALDRGLAGDDRALERVGDQAVLVLGRGVAEEAALLFGQVREVASDRRGHVAHHGEHRALGRRADRRVGALGGGRERGAEQHGIDQLARAGDQLLGRAADQLGEDHAAVAPRAQQGGAGHGLDDLVAADLVDRAALVGGQAVELGEHGLERERHVVARVAVGDREDVEIVDLLAA
jgi:hypothetical protein